VITINSTDTLQLRLAGAPATSNPSFFGSYLDTTLAGGITGDASIPATALNGTTPVSVFAAPAAGTSRHLQHLAMANTDTATITLRVLLGGTVVLSFTLAVGDVLQYDRAVGEFTVRSASGGLRLSSSVTWGSIVGTLSDQSDLQSALSAKVTGNVAITPGTGTKVTVDAKGLVTAVSAATTADINASTNRNYVTDAQLVVIGNTSGTNSGDETGPGIRTKLGITTLSGSNTGDQTISITGDVTASGSTGALSATVVKINGTTLSALGTGLLKNTTGTGVPSIAVAADLPGGPYATTASVSNVTNDVQTKASIVPNTVPTAGQIHVGNAGGTAFGVVSLSGDASLASTGAITVTRINGTSLAGLASGILKNTTGTGVPSIAVSGTDFKTVGGTSILGSGDIPIGGGSTPTGTGYRRVVAGTEDAAARTYAQVQGDLLVQPRGTQTIAMSNGTTTLTNASPRQTVFTGSGNTSHTVILPAANTLPFADWEYELDNASTGTGVLTVQANGATTLYVVLPGVCVLVNALTIATAPGTWEVDVIGNATPSTAVAISALQLFGHSYLDNANQGNSTTNILPNSNSNVGNILASALDINPSCVVNHAVTGSMLTSPLRAGGVNVGGGFAKALGEIQKKQAPLPPYSRNGEAYLICWGVNDTGNNSPANQSAINARAADAMTTIISKMRAATIINGSDTGLGLAYTGTWAAAAAGAIDYTGGKGWATSTTGGVFTFTLPLMYRGEPICFSMVGYSSANALTVTWSGTAGVTGTTTLNSLSPNAQCIVPKRITNLTAANAGQTIIGTVALTSQTFILDAVWIESIKPSPVLVCNQPRLPSRTINIASGAGTTTGVNTSFTDATIAFNSTTDAGAALAETDAQGAFTGNANTISSVTNATTVVLGSNAASAKSAIKYTLARKFNGYPTNGWTNTDFTGATVASHANADNAVLAWNTTVIDNVVALFDSMVQKVDLDSAIGQDATCPSTIYSWWDEVSFAHPNVWGNHAFAQAVAQAINKLQQVPTETILVGLLQNAGMPSYRPASYRRIIQNTAMSDTAGSLYLPDGAQIDVVANLYTCVAGDLFAYPFLITEPTIYAMGCKVEQVGATGTSSVRVGIYDDMAGPGGTPSGYPQCLRIDGGLTALTASSAVKALGNIYRPLYPGLWWLVFGTATLNVASTLRTIFGPNPMLPSWNGTLNGVVRPIAWKVTGQTLTSNLPSSFPSGGALVGCAGGTFASGSAAPLVSLMLNVF